MNEQKKPKGRPRVSSSGLPQENIKLTLDSNTVDFLKIFGNGSVSNGVRRAVNEIQTGEKMKNEVHVLDVNGRPVVVSLDIFIMSSCEAVDVYDLPEDLYFSGGFRIEALVNGIPAGTRFYSGNLGSTYWGGDSVSVAREFVNNLT